MSRVRVLVVTNDFPPRPGGIQLFVHELARRLPHDVVVLTSRHPGAREFDAAQPFPVERIGYYPMLPTPDVRRRAVALIREHGATAAWFGAAAPLGLLAPALRRAGVSRVVASTHGHEVGWAALPGARAVLGRIAAGVDVVTYLGNYQRRALARAVAGRAVLHRLPPGVDVERFRPDVSGVAVRRAHGLGERPVIVCVSRLVPRKGQDTLLRAMPRLRRAVPDAVLLLVGGGPDARRLRRLAATLDLDLAVRFAGEVPWSALPAYFAAGDVFAMPCRTRRFGLDVEGLGIVYLEASAAGLPVIAGNSGGAPDAVRDGETGYVVRGGDVGTLTDLLTTLLTDQPLRRDLGAAGRTWVTREWRWDVLAGRLARWLDPDVDRGGDAAVDGAAQP